ncbi:hypothetical protein ACIQ9P_02965 [Kitasatospora sp. NPDC094019]|uniref:hypothetical protein n=1 Tax=Kitasatospora sp. NPDC094019 TaxID=3364091 RepID=UPI0037F2DB79
MAVSKRSRTTIYRPELGEVVKDRAHKGVEGVYMDTMSGRVYLRPRGGGLEWTTSPGDIERIGEKPELIRVCTTNRPRRARALLAS